MLQEVAGLEPPAKCFKGHIRDGDGDMGGGLVSEKPRPGALLGITPEELGDFAACGAGRVFRGAAGAPSRTLSRVEDARFLLNNAVLTLEVSPLGLQHLGYGVNRPGSFVK